MNLSHFLNTSELSLGPLEKLRLLNIIRSVKKMIKMFQKGIKNLTLCNFKTTSCRKLADFMD